MKFIKILLTTLISLTILYILSSFIIITLFEKRITKSTHPTMVNYDKFAQSHLHNDYEVEIDKKPFYYHFFNNNAKKTIILTHGITSNKDNVVEIAKKLYDNKYNVILYDMRTNFENNKVGTVPTFGKYESDDLHKLITNFKTRYPNQKISLYGVSMGAATTILYAQKYDHLNDVQSYIAESSYTNMLDQFNQESKDTLPFGILWAKYGIDLVLKVKHNYVTSDADLRLNMKNIKHPMLLLSPNKDPRINPQNTKTLWELSNKKYVNYKYFNCNTHASSFSQKTANEFFKILLKFYKNS